MDDHHFAILRVAFASVLSWIFGLSIFLLILFSGCKKNIQDPKPGIFQQPENITVPVGGLAVFRVGALSKEPITFQWYRNGKPISGANDSIFTIPSALLTDSGSVFNVSIIHNEMEVNSKTAKLTVIHLETSVIKFTTEGMSFSPLIDVVGNPTILWIWADGTTSSSSAPVKNYGAAGKRVNTLSITPWSALKSINIGYDAQDGGSSDISLVGDQQVSMVEGLQVVAPWLNIWCSSYNKITTLDFNNFVQLHTIECFNSKLLTNVSLENTPALKRVCFEDCNLASLDLSQSPLVEDLPAALNEYKTIQFATVASHFRHICVRDNPQISDPSLFSNMSQFPVFSELWNWNTSQSGSLRISSSHPVNRISILSDGNKYTSVDLSGALQNATSLAEISFANNEIAHINITGCSQITKLQLQNNKLSVSEVNSILATLDGLGRNMYNTQEQYQLLLDISGNEAPDNVGYAHALNLASKGWKVIAQGWTLEATPPVDTGEAKINFITNGDSTAMRCDFIGSHVITWHWSDGTISNASSGADIVKSGLGSGSHTHYLLVSNGASLTRFGAAYGGGRGKLVSISDFINLPTLKVLYTYNESLFSMLGRTNTTRIEDYHLIGTNLSKEAMNQVFADAVLSGVLNGTIWYPNLGTQASDADRAILIARGWTL